MTFKTQTLIRIISLISLLTSSLAIAQNETTTTTPSASSVAQVVWTQGEVIAKHADNTSETLKRHSQLFKGDSIQTGSDGTGQIIFTDQTMLSLMASTLIKIDDYLFNKGQTKGDEKYLVSLAKGGFRTVTGLIGKNNPANYKVSTPVATIGVSGSEGVYYCSDANCNSGNVCNCNIRVLSGAFIATSKKTNQRLIFNVAHPYGLMEESGRVRWTRSVPDALRTVPRLEHVNQSFFREAALLKPTSSPAAKAPAPKTPAPAPKAPAPAPKAPVPAPKAPIPAPKAPVPAPKAPAPAPKATVKCTPHVVIKK